MKKSLLFTVLFLSAPAFAGGFIRAGGVYLSESSGQGTQSKSTRTLIDLGAGYVSDGGWVLGGLYAMEKRKFGDGTTSDRTSLGPTVGWMSKDSGPYILGTYFLQSELEQFEGTGYQADLGYKFQLGRVALAMQLSYKAFEYDEANGTTLNPPYEDSYVDPYFVLWIDF